MKRIFVGTVVSIAMFLFVATGCTAKPSLKITTKSVGPGEEITVEYKTPKGYKENAWIGIIPSNIEHGSEATNDKHDVAYTYLKGSTSGTFTFKAPIKPGSYDFRMHDTDAGGTEVASVTFRVEEKKTEQASELTASAGGIGLDDAVMVEWKGSWWPAKVIAIGKGKAPYKIHYDGYSSSWDEWVGDARIKKK
ncbi:MAG: Tudor-knot domain-containing protein [Pseudomonadota bacterium]